MGESIMEYIDRQQGIELTSKDYADVRKLKLYIEHNLNKDIMDDILSKNNMNKTRNHHANIDIMVWKIYKNGLRLELLETEYKDLPLDWVIKLFI